MSVTCSRLSRDGSQISHGWLNEVKQMELFKAHKQWSERPNDERFPTLQALYNATREYADLAREKELPFSDLRVEAIDADVQLVGRKGIPAKLTNWVFGQLCSRLGAPASYLRELPATLAAQNLNHGFAHRAGEMIDAGNSNRAQLLFHMNGDSLLLRALTSDKYSRIWNFEIAERLLDLESQGWSVAMPDIRSLGDDKPPLYASDHDMFAFLRMPNVVVAENLGNGNAPIYRGLIAENSEVGASSLKLTRFFYNEMCGNHIIWGASNVVEISVRHVGNARERWSTFAVQVARWSNESATDEIRIIESAKSRIIAATKDEVLDALFGKRIPGLTRKVLQAGYDCVVPDQDGNPNTVWGIVQGITRHSQSYPHADTRTAIDRAAGKLLTLNF